MSRQRPSRREGQRRLGRTWRPTSDRRGPAGRARALWALLSQGSGAGEVRDNAGVSRKSVRHEQGRPASTGHRGGAGVGSRRHRVRDRRIRPSDPATRRRSPRHFPVPRMLGTAHGRSPRVSGASDRIDTWTPSRLLSSSSAKLTTCCAPWPSQGSGSSRRPSWDPQLRRPQSTIGCPNIGRPISGLAALC